jgi:hypothetical protein
LRVPATRIAVAIATLFAVLTWAAVWWRFNDAEPDRGVARPPSLRAWDFEGCLELVQDPWSGEGGSPAGAPDLPRFLSLVPDSLDEWGRSYDTYRAVPLGETGRPPYRWFVRADTLWVVWSGTDLRGGLALLEVGSSLAGRARVTSQSGPVDLSARVEAWKVNCWSRDRPSPDRVRR